MIFRMLQTKDWTDNKLNLNKLRWTTGEGKQWLAYAATALILHSSFYLDYVNL